MSRGDDGFKLEDYEPVADRLAKFWADHPEGRVLTGYEVERTTLRVGDETHEQIGGWIFRAEVWRTESDRGPAATGFARQEFLEQPPPKRNGDPNVYAPEWTSPVEVAETSAIGRALANLGYATKRPSREEMRKAVKMSPEDQAWNSILGLIGGDQKAGNRLWFAARDALQIPEGEHLTADQANQVVTEARKLIDGTDHA